MRLSAAATAATSITRANIPAVAALAAQLTRHHPAAAWLTPDPGSRAADLRGCYRLLLGHALRYGYVDVLADDCAVAIWLDRTQPTPEVADRLRRLRQVCGADVGAALLLLDVAACHQPLIPHLQLAVLATDDPAAAAALLTHRQRQLDRVNIAAFAYAGTQTHLGVLMDAGFQPGEAVWLPAGPPLWPTLRPPAGLENSAAIRPSAC
ncbi:hypothetical protein [Actinoplanes aureus]|uniref:Uncharacterized protein n=1 Tax=Actinoplanes aureus TaxID=2792083 RepID=A0A931CGG9_9ACTN|nr:hypothetical protein [Actinoplanes aureus]MBG0567542.1 hypothetical protein [Actinoplanes aureus]